MQRLTHTVPRLTISLAVPVLLMFAHAAAQENSKEQRKAPAPEAAASLEQIATGFRLAEGPVWDGETLIFSDVPPSKIHKLGSDGKVSTIRSETRKGAGLAFDSKRRLLICEVDGFRVTRIEKDGSEKILAESYAGKKLNGPNDLTVDATDGIYFTDPLFLNKDKREQDKEAVYYISPEGKVLRVADDLEKPNGIALAGDGKTLFVADSVKSKLRAYPVKEDGTLGEGRDFGSVPGPDGVRVDLDGKVYAAGRTGIAVWDASGKRLGTLKVPAPLTSLAFGGPDRRTMFITTNPSVFKIRLDQALRELTTDEPATAKEPPAAAPVNPEGLAQRIQGKIKKLQEGVQKWQNEGKDPSPIAQLMQQFGPLMHDGKVEEAEKILDKALSELGIKNQDTPPAKSDAPSPTPAPVNPQERIQQKAERVQAGIQKWTEGDKDPSAVAAIIQEAGSFFEGGKSKEGEAKLDEALALLEGKTKPGKEAPPASSAAPAPGTDIATINHRDFSNPELVTILGYSGPQQDPNLSPDGQHLFFDSHNDAGLPMYPYMASRIDYKTFKFIGRVPGVNIEGVEPVEDLAHNFYFVSPLLLGKGGATTIGRGVLSDGSVTNVAPIKGISPKPASSGNKGITLDLFITPDGKTLYFSDFVVNARFKPQGAQLAIATKNSDGSFTRLPNSDEILKSINGLGKLVYNATPSADGLTLVFNAAPSYGPLPQIYIATRSSTSAPFGTPRLVGAAAQIDQGTFSEPGSFSPDGKHLYFHRVLNDSASQLYVLTVDEPSTAKAPPPAAPAETVQQRIMAKVERIKAGAQKMAESGRDPSAILKTMQEKVGPLLDAGKIAEAEPELDLVLELLAHDGKAPADPPVVRDKSPGSTQAATRPLREIIVSYSDETNKLQLYRVNEDGSARRRITDGTHDCMFPAWSPDGEKIVYVQESENGTALWLSDPDGKNPKMLISSGLNMVPSWLPDSRHIVWMELKSGKKPAEGQLNIMNTETLQSRRLFSDPEQAKFSNLMPVVSPDGTKVAFVSNRSGQYRIWLSNLDGSDARLVSPVSADVDETLQLPIEQKVPSWSPDGRWIAHWEGVEMDHLSKFTGKADSQRDALIGGTWNVWIVGSDGQNKRKAGRGDDPNWSPDGFVTRSFPDPTKGGANVMVERKDGWKELPIVPAKTLRYGRFTWKP